MKLRKWMCQSTVAVSILLFLKHMYIWLVSFPLLCLTSYYLLQKTCLIAATISRAEDFLRHSSTTLRRITMAATMEATSAVLPTTSGRTNSHYVGIGQCERKEYWGWKKKWRKKESSWPLVDSMNTPLHRFFSGRVEDISEQLQLHIFMYVAELKVFVLIMGVYLEERFSIRTRNNEMDNGFQLVSRSCIIWVEGSQITWSRCNRSISLKFFSMKIGCDNFAVRLEHFSN